MRMAWPFSKCTQNRTGSLESNWVVFWKVMVIWLESGLSWIIHATSPARMQGRRGEAV